MKTYLTMLRTELKLSLRGIEMLIFAICMPVVVFLILGLYLAASLHFRKPPTHFWNRPLGLLPLYPSAPGGVMGLPLVISDYRNK